jgi:hypothetical protein
MVAMFVAACSGGGSGGNATPSPADDVGYEDPDYLTERLCAKLGDLETCDSVVGAPPFANGLNGAPSIDVEAQGSQSAPGNKAILSVASDMAICAVNVKVPGASSFLKLDGLCNAKKSSQPIEGKLASPALIEIGIPADYDLPRLCFLIGVQSEESKSSRADSVCINVSNGTLVYDTVRQQTFVETDPEPSRAFFVEYACPFIDENDQPGKYYTEAAIPLVLEGAGPITLDSVRVALQFYGETDDDGLTTPVSEGGSADLTVSIDDGGQPGTEIETIKAFGPFPFGYPFDQTPLKLVEFESIDHPELQVGQKYWLVLAAKGPERMCGSAFAATFQVAGSQAGYRQLAVYDSDADAEPTPTGPFQIYDIGDQRPPAIQVYSQ